MVGPHATRHKTLRPAGTRRARPRDQRLNPWAKRLAVPVTGDFPLVPAPGAA